MWNRLIDAGDPGQEVLYAYTVKERLRELLALSGTDPDRSVISHRLWLFYEQAASSRSPEIHRLAATINPAQIGRRIADLQTRLIVLAKAKTEQLYLASIPSALPDVRKGVRVQAKPHQPPVSRAVPS